MRKMLGFGTAAVLLATLWTVPPPAGAQTGTGTITGTVFRLRGERERPARRAQVCIFGDSVDCLTTARRGSYSVTLPAGAYGVNVTYRDLICIDADTDEQTADVLLTAGATVTVDWLCGRWADLFF